MHLHDIIFSRLLQDAFIVKTENTPDMVYPLKAISLVDAERLKKLIFMVTNKEEIN